MKRQEFKFENSGSYALAFQRNGERPLIDLAFFDGDRSIEECKQLRTLLDRAIACSEMWEAQEGKPRQP